MSHKNLDSLSRLLNSVISGNEIVNVMKITNPQYTDLYLTIFLDEIEKNNGDPVPYDAFCNRLWINLNKGINSFAKEANDFMQTWSAWVYLYKNLKENNKLK